MNKKIFWLRVSYWAGAICDGFMVIPMLFPKIGGAMLGLDNFNPGVEYKYAMYVGASLMTGWTFLLVWADRKPVERRGVLLLTVFPVLVGLLISGIYAVVVKYVAFENMIPTYIGTRVNHSESLWIVKI